MSRIPTLDGWRGIAIALVLFDHIQDSLNGGYLRPWTQTGNHGVTIFFVLSGFLITSKLIERPIDLKRFYVRRFLRLMPVAWTYLAVLLAINCTTRFKVISLSQLRACVLFYQNYSAPSSANLAGHFWSLSLEEQFYLVWPCLLAFAGTRRCRWIAVAGAIGCAGYRWMFWAAYDRNTVNGQSQVRADALLIGCLLALFLSESGFRSWAARWSRMWALPSFVMLLFCIRRYHWLPPLYESLAIAGLIAASQLHPRSMFSSLLSSMPLVWLGTISYSLYVWQELFMGFRSPVAVFLIMPAVAVLSYVLIERPFTRLGHRVTTPAPAVVPADLVPA